MQKLSTYLAALVAVLVADLCLTFSARAETVGLGMGKGAHCSGMAAAGIARADEHIAQANSEPRLVGAVSASAAPPENGRLPPNVVPVSYDLELEIDPRQERFSGKATIRVEFRSHSRAFWIHGQGLQVTKVVLQHDREGEVAAGYEESSAQRGWARVSLEREVSPGEGNLTITYNAPFAGNASGLYLFEQSGEQYAATHFEPAEARRVFPAFDEPRFKTAFSLSIIAPDGNVVIANMPEDRSEPISGGRTRHGFLRSQPLPTYLVAFAVGPFDLVEVDPLAPNSVRGHAVGLRGAAPRGKGEKLALALEKSRPFVQWLEDYFATPYPYPKLDLLANPEESGAMENAGLIIFNERFLLLGEDAPIMQMRIFGEVLAHEIAHQWFGNLVTPAWWDDLWLKEAFATWISFKVVRGVMPELGLDNDVNLRAQETMVAHDSLASARQIRQPIEHVADIADAFDMITYDKGGGVLAMAESYLGEDAFRDGAREHMRRFPFGVATTSDFFESLGRGSAKPEIVAALDSFTSLANAPIVRVRCEASKPSAIEIKQATYEPLGIELPARTWALPMCLSLYSAGRDPIKMCKMLSEDSGTIPLDGACPDFIVPNTNGAGYYVFGLEEESWSLLARNFAVLPAGEQITALFSADAGFRNGSLEPRTLLAIIEAGARASDPSTKLKAVAIARKLEFAISDSSIESYRAWVRHVWDRPQNEPAMASSRVGTERKLATETLQLVALSGESTGTRAALLKSARSLLGLDAASDSIDPDIRELALVVGVEDGGPEVFATLLKLATATADLQFKRESIRALGHARRPADQQAFIQAVSSGQLSATEAARALNWRLSDDRRSAAFAWEAGRATFASLVERVPAAMRQAMPRFGSGLCSLEAREELTAFFNANGAESHGQQRSLAQVKEQIVRCAALRERRGAELAALLLADRD